MNKKELYKLKTESEVKHLLSKLNENEAEALKKITEHEDEICKLKNKIVDLKSEITNTQEKKESLKKQFNAVINASDENWKIENEKLISEIEALENKNIFVAKTEEWYNSIRNTAGELKADIKDIIKDW
ncbi:MAG: hypothetical protein C0594_11960 [Marinilabiliales bacterium]|nr:MAG: hypothetical protein C0594_11960 [Marinilabiliales bacterium]